jgi:hypothetical protein
MTENAMTITTSWLRRLTGRTTMQGKTIDGRSGASWFGETEEELVENISMADIPTPLKRRLQEEALQTTFHRLEQPLRFLLYATAPGREPDSLQECQDILHLWRQGLEQEARLLPDNFAGAMRNYEPGMDTAYTIKGRCRPGQAVRITVPAWRLHGQVVVRGEAEPVCD